MGSLSQPLSVTVRPSPNSNHRAIPEGRNECDFKAQHDLMKTELLVSKSHHKHANLTVKIQKLQQHRWGSGYSGELYDAQPKTSY